MIPYAAKAYAAALGNCNSFQTFDDSPLKRPELARIFHGAEPPAELAALNDAGAGVFCTINATDGRGRKASNIKTIRALACDFDHGHPDTWHLPPSMIVRSANGLHVYWFVDDCPLDQFKPAQQRLAAMYGSDSKVCDLPRVLRVPGYLHLKDAPFLVRLVSCSGIRYRLADVLRDVPPLPAPPTPAPRSPRDPSLPRGRRLADIDVLSEFRDAGLYRCALGGGKHAVICPWEGEHTRPDYSSERGDSTVIWETSASGTPVFHCSHSHCDRRYLVHALKQLGTWQ